MEKSRSVSSISYNSTDDFYEEWIFRMNNQELKNLDQLENSDVMLARRAKKNFGSFVYTKMPTFRSSST